MLSFSVTPTDRLAIEQAAERALAMDAATNKRYARKIMDWQMDFTAVHANGCPLDFGRLNAADDFNFAHDAFGIARHLDRETGQLTNCFLPRFAAKCQDALPGDGPRLREAIAAKRRNYDGRRK